ncbi:hypothetical protein PG995_013668 [Apiospora arundinis]
MPLCSFVSGQPDLPQLAREGLAGGGVGGGGGMHQMYSLTSSAMLRTQGPDEPEPEPEPEPGSEPAWSASMASLSSWNLETTVDARRSSGMVCALCQGNRHGHGRVPVSRGIQCGTYLTGLKLEGAKSPLK